MELSDNEVSDELRSEEIDDEQRKKTSLVDLENAFDLQAIQERIRSIRLQGIKSSLLSRSAFQSFFKVERISQETSRTSLTSAT